MAVLVTGVSSGIGRAIAEKLIGDGRRVVGVSRRDPSLPGCEWVSADLSSASELGAVAADVAGRGDLDAVVHAAGVQFSAPLGKLDHEDGARMWALHVDAPSRLVDAVVGGLPDGARIVLIGSRTATGVAGKSQYSATKAALIGLTRSWAMELAPRRITVNVVAPGPTATAMLQDPNRSATPPRVPALGRFVEPSEVAGLTAFLLGPDGGSITGQHLVICGGASL
ncbi:SDR family NAD(P)-dependent oxidoreductase [Kineosporia babensis]|uniref:SDR family oxidoreductase n=1 Tax=Kineosporia babensis TaxID=499548 RepID=A0A9X1NHC8_9ACTN|nr:SDR family oxidoreductase [Kineosporia babensis]MCD5315107.1 SDR family oxidoreductase [Kineosporia babensis]